MGIGDQNADRCCHTPHKQDKIRGGGAYYNTKPKQIPMKDERPGHCSFVDPHHFSLDSTFHFDADPDPDYYLMWMRIRHVTLKPIRMQIQNPDFCWMRIQILIII
jgi:hypothetical protein